MNIKYIDLSPEDSLEDLPLGKKLIALFFAKQRNKLRETERKLEEEKIRAHLKLKANLVKFFDLVINKMERENLNNCEIKVAKNFNPVLDEVLSMPKFKSLYKFKIIHRVQNRYVSSHIIMRVERITK